MRRALLARSYRAAVMALNPVAYWRLGETSGPVAADEMGTHGGTYVGSPTLGVAGALAGDPNTSVTLNGTTQYIDVPPSADLHPGDVFSIAAWVRRTSTGAAAHIYSNFAVDDIQFWIWSGDNRLYLSRFGGAHAYTSTLAIADTEWHQVVVTKDGASVAGYIDGVASANLAGGATIVPTVGAQTRIGAGTGFLPGSLDEVHFWNRALPAADPARLYQIGRGF